MTRILLVLLAIPALTFSAEQAVGVSPLLPEDGAITGPSPLFQITYRGLEDADLRHARFRISLSEDGFRTESVIFDQRQRLSGWSPGDDGRYIYHPLKPLEDGSYEWRVQFWNGTIWSGGSETHSLRIDTIPPAPVTGLLLEELEEGAKIRLSWKPVAFDLEGGAEYVTRYHIYRYRDVPPFPLTAAYEIATTEDLSVVVDSSAPEATDLFYRVTAEDEAGNETGKRR